MLLSIAIPTCPIRLRSIFDGAVVLLLRLCSSIADLCFSTNALQIYKLCFKTYEFLELGSILAIFLVLLSGRPNSLVSEMSWASLIFEVDAISGILFSLSEFIWLFRACRSSSTLLLFCFSCSRALEKSRFADSMMFYKMLNHTEHAKVLAKSLQSLILLCWWAWILTIWIFKNITIIQTLDDFIGYNNDKIINELPMNCLIPFLSELFSSFWVSSGTLMPFIFPMNFSLRSFMFFYKDKGSF